MSNNNTNENTVNETNQHNNNIKDENGNDNENNNKINTTKTKSNELNKTYLYQNSKTREVSKKVVTTSQLCRILCPYNSQQTTTTTTPINSNTYIIGYNTETTEYDTVVGWRQIKDVPILREACVNQWYYEYILVLDSSNLKDDGDDEGKDKNGGSKIEGPVCIREMARLFWDDRIISDQTRVWCNELSSFIDNTDADTNGKESSGGEWKNISGLPYLVLALEVFRNQTMKTTNNNTDPTSMIYEDDETSTMTSKQQLIESSNEKSDMNKKTNDATSRDDNDDSKQLNEEEQAELELFLSSVKIKSNSTATADYDDEEEEEEEEEGFESDGGTAYTKDSTTGQWVPSSSHTTSKSKRIKPNTPTAAPEITSTNNNNTNTRNKRKRKKPQFAAKNARNWIYISNLPSNTTRDEIAKYFARAGVLDLDPETQLPKIKLYTHKEKGGTKVGQLVLKGDASLCYAYPESVDIALQVLDGSFLRFDKDEDVKPLSVIRAKFEKKGACTDTNGGVDRKPSGKNTISNTKRKIAKLAARQAVDWDDTATNGRICGGRKGLRIIVLRHMFTAATLDEDHSSSLEKDIYSTCSPYGNVEKITICSKHADRVVIVKFTQPHAASQALEDVWNEKIFQNMTGTSNTPDTTTKQEKVQASFWDGVTDYTTNSGTINYEKVQKEEEQRLDEFGDWLDNQVVPQEFLPRFES